MFGVRVNGGTGAGAKRRPAADVARCECGGFIAKIRADAGATLCVRCEQESK